MGFLIALMRDRDGDELEVTASDAWRWEAHGYRVIETYDSDPEVRDNHEQALQAIADKAKADRLAAAEKLAKAKEDAKNLSEKPKKNK